MMGRPDLGTLRNRLQGTAATALGLVLIALLFVYAVPRRAEIAASFEAGRGRAVQETSAEPEPERADVPDPVEAPKVVSVAPEPVLAAPAVAPPQAGRDDAPAANASAPAADGASMATLLPRPVALDTETIMIRRGRVRLTGIAPVPLGRKCGSGRETWFCGVEARTQFRAFLRARSITCDVPDGFGEKAEEIGATCALAGEDIGRWLVANGWAEAAPGGPYAPAERNAREGRLGVWADRRPGT